MSIEPLTMAFVDDLLEKANRDQERLCIVQERKGMRNELQHLVKCVEISSELNISQCFKKGGPRLKAIDQDAAFLDIIQEQGKKVK